MIDAEAGIAPVTATARIDALDVLRGIAICGILLMNIPEMGGIGESVHANLPDHWSIDWLAFAVQQVLFNGTMRGLFTLLFGAGMVLMLRRAEGPDGRATPIDIWVRRCIALMALGIVQFGVFFWPGEILWTYGLSGLFLLAFRTARVRTLLIAGTLMLVVLTGWMTWQAETKRESIAVAQAARPLQAAGRRLSDEQKTAVEALEKSAKVARPSAADRAEDYARRTRLPSLLAWSASGWAEWNLEPDGWVWLLESVGFMLFGVALFRTGILTGEAPAATYRRLMLIGYGGGIALRLIVFGVDLGRGYAPDPWSPSIPYLFWQSAAYEPGRLLVTLGHVGLIVGLFRVGAFGRAWPVRALGRMALTVYSLQSILTSILFYGFGLLGRFGFAELMGLAVCIWIVTGLFCLSWLRRHDQGPAEAALRAVAYGTFRRRRGEAAQVLAASPPL